MAETEDTVRLARKDFTRRRWSQRLRRGRPALLLLLALVVVGAGVWLVYFSPAITARQVDVTGATNVRQSKVRTVAEVPIGTPLARISLSAIQSRVETIPVVKSAEVSRSWPHGISIRITERTPLAVIDQGHGLQALDGAGVLFGSYARRPAGLPLVHSAAGTKVDALSEVAKVVSSLPPNISRKVDYVEVATVDQIELAMKDGKTVTWGSSQDSGEKAEVLAVLLKQHATKIDVSAPGRPTTS
ncbi:MAG: FtsQ-type protein [Marmoricola sp.]|nr:FtsQ-type protein [Marmoricola sp.]